jgi:hypothetical protein
MDLTDFITTEREKYSGDDNNRFAFSISQVSRYIRFLEIIYSRYEAANEAVVRSFRELMEKMKGDGPRQMTEEEIEEMGQHSKLQVALHLEIESYYLFADILLDKIAHFIEDYFGQARDIGLRSHRRLCESFDAYCAAKGIASHLDMAATATRLETTIGDHRDKQIAHLQSPRTLHGTYISPSGRASISRHRLYARDSETALGPSEAHIHELHPMLEQYVSQLVLLVKQNRERSRFKLN